MFPLVHWALLSRTSFSGVASLWLWTSCPSTWMNLRSPLSSFSLFLMLWMTATLRCGAACWTLPSQHSTHTGRYGSLLFPAMFWTLNFKHTNYKHTLWYDHLCLAWILYPCFFVTGQCELPVASVWGVSEERPPGRQLWLCPSECGYSHGLPGQTSGQKWPQGQTHCGQAHHCTLYTFTAGKQLILLPSYWLTLYCSVFIIVYNSLFIHADVTLLPFTLLPIQPQKFTTIFHMVCHLSSGSGVCGQLFTSFSPCHQGGRCRDCEKPAAAAAGERQVCREKGSSIRTGWSGQRSWNPGAQTAGNHDHADWCHPGQEKLQTEGGSVRVIQPLNCLALDSFIPVFADTMLVCLQQQSIFWAKK